MGNNLTSRLSVLHPLDTADFSSYEDACRDDPDVRTFDANLKARTGRVLNALANGVDQFSLSLDSLKEVTTSLLEMDHDVMQMILEYKKDVWDNPDLFLLVEEFFDNSLATLEFCTAAETSIKRAKDNQLILQMAITRMPSERDPTEAEIERVLAELISFRTAENPFGEDFVLKFRAVQDRHTQMLEKLLLKKRRLDKKLKGVRMWAKLSSIMFATVVAAVLICSVVAAALAAPPIAAALAAAVSFPLSSMGAWVNSLWSGYEKEITTQREVIHGMHMGTFIAIHDLRTLGTLVDNLEAQLKSIVFNIDFSDERRDAVALRLAVDEINAKRLGFMQGLEDLEVHVDRVDKRIRQARAIVLQRISRRSDRRKRPLSF